MKKHILGFVASSFLAAVCHAAPATVVAPANPDEALTQVTQRDERIVAYFDQEENVVKAPAEKGSYRKLYGKTAQGNYIVQDFYQDSNTKMIDPMEITSEKGLTSKHRYQYIKTPTVKNEYNDKGKKTITVQYFEDGSALGESYYPDGQLKMQVKQKFVNKEESKDGFIRMYFEDGSKMHMETSAERTTIKGWYGNGQPAFEISPERFAGWDAKGKALSKQKTEALAQEFQQKGSKLFIDVAGQ